MPTRKIPEKFQVAFSLAGEQRDLVRAVAEAVENELGSPNVFFDEWFEHYIAGSDADLKLQDIYGKQCELVVVCVSEHYGGKPWTLVEHEAIRSRMFKARVSADESEKLRILPIRVGDGEVKGVPFNSIVPDIRKKSAAEAAKLIIDRLSMILPDTDNGAPAASGWPEQSLSLDWPIADNNEVRTAFERLMTCAAPRRFLPVCGPSESGKSVITSQMLGNALRIPNLACGRFDFKGTTDMDAELRIFIQHLEVPLPPDSPRLNERFSYILDVLKQRAQPVLLIFDTYEAAGEAEEWVNRQLLQSLIRATWLRIVIAGQRVPERLGAIWDENAYPIMTLKPPPPADWLDYARRHRSDLSLENVETACNLARNKATLLAQLLGPVT